MPSCVITATRPNQAAHVNAHFNDHLEGYLTRRGFTFERLFDTFLVHSPEPDLFTIRCIAQRYGQTHYFAHTSHDEFEYRPLWEL